MAAADQGDFRSNADFVDEKAKIGLPERDLSRRDGVAHHSAKSHDLVRRDVDAVDAPGHNALFRHGRDVPVSRGLGDTRRELRVRSVHDSLFDRLVKTVESQLGLREFGFDAKQLAPIPTVDFLHPIADLPQKIFEAMRLQDALAQGRRDRLVESLHADRMPGARRFAARLSVRAGIIPIASRLARADRHGGPALRATRDTGEKNGPAHRLRRIDPRILRAENFLNGAPLVDRDDRGDGDLHDLVLAAFGAGSRVGPIILMHALVGGAREELVEGPDMPKIAVSGSEAVVVQMRDNLLDAERARFADALRGEIEYETNHRRLDFVHLQFLLHLLSADLGDDGLVAIGWGRAVPKSFLRIGDHGTTDVLRIFLRAVFVENGEHLPDHISRIIVSGRLRYRTVLDAVRPQVPDGELENGCVTEESGERMDDDRVKRARNRIRVCEQALEFGPLLGPTANASLDIFLDDHLSPRITIRSDGALLVFEGQPLLGLALRRHSIVCGHSHRHLRQTSFLDESFFTSSAASAACDLDIWWLPRKSARISPARAIII